MSVAWLSDARSIFEMYFATVAHQNICILRDDNNEPYLFCISGVFYGNVMLVSTCGC